MLNIESYNKQIEREEWIKRFGMRSSTLCAVLFIAAVIYLAVQWGYVGTTRFTAFCAAAAVYLLCKWVVYPLLWRTASLVRPHQETFYRHRTFSSALGCGNVLLGRFHICPSWPSVSYSFLSLCFIPLIPHRVLRPVGDGKERPLHRHRGAFLPAHRMACRGGALHLCQVLEHGHDNIPAGGYIF